MYFSFCLFGSLVQAASAKQATARTRRTFIRFTTTRTPAREQRPGRGLNDVPSLLRGPAAEEGYKSQNEEQVRCQQRCGAGLRHGNEAVRERRSIAAIKLRRIVGRPRVRNPTQQRDDEVLARGNTLVF